ncbi:MAG: CHAT domain-containing protein [Pyrinomonadaceae bacterium]|nr:CHAT domain-containing protein [Pyrinomonadaceae bacterium]
MDQVEALERSFAKRVIEAKADKAEALLTDPDFKGDRGILAKEILDELSRRNGKMARREQERIARIGASIAESANNKREVARAWLAIGSMQDEKIDKVSAFKKALAAADEAQANDLALELITNIGRLEENMVTQIQWYKSGIPYAERMPDNRAISNLIGRIAISYTIMGDFPTARTYHARAFEIRKAMNDLTGIAATISNLGIISVEEGDLSAGIESFTQSLAILDSIKGPETPDLIQRKLRDLRNLGITYQGMGNHVQALAYYSKSLKMSEVAKNETGVYGALFQIASLYNSQGQYELARQTLRRADNVSTDDKISEESIGILGASYLGEEKYEQALNIYHRQLSTGEKEGNKLTQLGKFMDIGNVYLLLGDAEKAGSFFERAERISLEIRAEGRIYGAIVGLARSSVMAGDFDKAIKQAERAKEQFKNLKGIQESWELYGAIGTAYSGLGKPELARLNFQKAIDLVEDQRGFAASGSEEAAGSFSRSITPYQLMVESLVTSGSFEAAYTFTERAKARILLEALGPKVKINGAMSPTESKNEQDLKNAIVSLGKEIQFERSLKIQNTANLRRLETKLDDKRREFQGFRNQIYLDHPELRVQRGEMSPIGLDEAASMLPDLQSAFLEFVVSQKNTFASVITKNSAGRAVIKTYTISAKRKDIAARLEVYRDRLASGDLDFQKVARELYELLLKPAEKELAGKTNIIVIPDGPLWDLPFQALQDGKGKYLVEKAAISYAPSLTALREMRKRAKTRKPSPDAELLAFGNPIIGRSTAERVQRIFMSEKLEPIPEAERLVNSLAKMYGPTRSKVYTGADAREEVAKTESPKYRIVQFATHGILNNVSPMYSHLVLAQNEKNPNEDGLLEAWEMKDLDLKADMVILSACETARGKISGGEGVIGMTWASFIAGAPTTVASQWKVESKSTTELMLEFHRQLLTGKGISKSEALRRASLKLMKMPQYKHPSYWAGFVMIGDGS